MPLEGELIAELRKQGADFVYFVDISNLAYNQNKGFPVALLFGITLSPAYLQKIIDTPDYVVDMVRKRQFDQDEFHLKELKTDELADQIANYIRLKGYAAYSQSEDNIYLTGFYDLKTKNTPLPHKTIAGMAGLGWIGKHNLLVTPEYGSAISICTILTDAPLKTVLFNPAQSKCGSCTVCINSCPVNALKGNSWNSHTSRDELVDVYHCITCLKCLAFCPWTLGYIKNGSLGKIDSF